MTTSTSFCKEREFITVRAELLGIDGPRRYIVFKDDEGRYYINDPHTQEKLLIDDLPQTQMKLFGETLEGKRFSMMGDIRMQEAQGRKLGNQTTLKDAESFYAGQEELARDLGKMGEGTVNTVFGYRDTLRYLEIERFKLDQDREQIERQIKIYEDKLSENARELSGKETELAETRGKLAELKQRLNEFTERKELLDRQIEATQNMNAASGEKIKSMFNEAARLYDDGKGLSFEAISKQLEQNDTSNGKILSTIAMQMFEVHQSALEKRAEQAQVQQNTSQIDEAMNAFASRHEFLQSLYGEGPGQWALDNLADWMIEAGALTADDKVQKAWENPITLDGKGVYRDNKTLKLYTYDETTETRTYIENPVIIAELYKRANVDGDLFMNETPNSEDAENGFVDTFRALLAADELRKAIKSVEITAKFNALNAQTEAAALAQKHGVDIKFPAARHEDAGQLSSTYNKDVIPSQNTEIAITEQDVNQRPTTSPAS
ncbi:MAG: hypothetical protein H6861_07230 [Rhodospirillales bacterium]|nr:hypothetical protein [Rhodospirillales bacterium]